MEGKKKEKWEMKVRLVGKNRWDWKKELNKNIGQFLKWLSSHLDISK